VCIYRADPFAKKDWYDIKAPSVFQVKNVGKTLVTRTQGTKVIFFFFFSFVCLFSFSGFSKLFGCRENVRNLVEI
jgi:hypothetical protein